MKKTDIMGNKPYNFDNLIEIRELAALRTICGLDCATDNTIRTQINDLETGKRTSEEVGFEVERPKPTIVLLRILDPRLELFRNRLGTFVEKNWKNVATSASKNVATSVATK